MHDKTEAAAGAAKPAAAPLTQSDYKAMLERCHNCASPGADIGRAPHGGVWVACSNAPECTMMCHADSWSGAVAMWNRDELSKK